VRVTTRERELARILRAAALAAEDQIQDEFDDLVARLPDDWRLRDELERAIDDVHDSEVQADLRRLLLELDTHRERLGWALDFSASRALDKVRTIATDIESGFL
jgi:hypothetical protein